MANVNIDGDAVEAIFLEAINAIPCGASAIARMISINHRGKPLSNQQLFKKTMQSMKKMNVGNEDTILKATTQNYLHRNFNLPACDISAYDLKFKKGSITLNYNPSNTKTIPIQFWANKRQDETISEARPERKYTPLTEKEITERINENTNWIGQKKVYKQRLVKMFSANSEQLSEIFKDNIPRRADFSDCEIRNFDFTPYNLNGADFHGAHCINCTFKKAEQADFTDTLIDGCIFAGSSLAASDFAKSVINTSSFDNANLRGSSFNAAECSDVTFRDALFKDTSVDFAKSKNIVFDSVRVRKPRSEKAEDVSKAPAAHRQRTTAQEKQKSVTKSTQQSVESDASPSAKGKERTGQPKNPIKPVEHGYDCTIDA